MMVFGEVVVVLWGVVLLRRLICVLVHVVRVGCAVSLKRKCCISVSIRS